jgi:hypothetical protein
VALGQRLQSQAGAFQGEGRGADHSSSFARRAARQPDPRTTHRLPPDCVALRHGI